MHWFCDNGYRDVKEEKPQRNGKIEEKWLEPAGARVECIVVVEHKACNPPSSIVLVYAADRATSDLLQKTLGEDDSIVLIHRLCSRYESFLQKWKFFWNGGIRHYLPCKEQP